MTGPLAPGETELRRWTISRRAFALRMAVLVAITFVFVPLGAPFVDWRTILIALIVLVPTYMWALGDFSLWRDNAGTLWVLTDQALHIIGPQDEAAVPLRLPLEQIKKVSRWPLWSLVLRLRTGQAITLPLVPAPARLKAEILAARDQAMNR